MNSCGTTDNESNQDQNICPPLRHFSLSDPRVRLEASKVPINRARIAQINGPDNSQEAGSNWQIQICVHFELAEPLLISDIQLISGSLELSHVTFIFLGAQQKHDAADSTNRVDMTKLKTQTFIVPENNPGFRLGVTGIAQAVWLMFEARWNRIPETSSSLDTDSDHLLETIRYALLSDEEAHHDSTQGKNKKGDSPAKNDANGHQIEKQISTTGDPHIHSAIKNKKLPEIENTLELFRSCFQSVELYGYALSSSPPLQDGILLLNTSILLRRSGRQNEAIVAEFLYALCLSGQRKCVSASEVLEKISKYYKHNFLESVSLSLSFSESALERIISLVQEQQDAQLDTQNIQTDKNSENKESRIVKVFQEKANFSPPSTFTKNISVTQNQNLLMAAKMQLLNSDVATKQNSKIDAYVQAVIYYTGLLFPRNKRTYFSLDWYSKLLGISNVLIELCLECITDSQENVQLSAIKALGYLVDKLGCSLDNQLQNILLKCLQVYPLLPLEDEDLDGPQNKENKQNFRGENLDPAVSKTKQQTHGQILLGQYHYLFESIINVLASASSQILRDIFENCISPFLLSAEIPQKLRVFVFRIAEKILAICQGDVKVDLNFFHYMLFAIDEELEGTQGSNGSADGSDNCGLRLWETMKTKLIYNMEVGSLNEVVCWVAEMLLVLIEEDEEEALKTGDSEFRSSVLSKVFQLLDLITIITARSSTFSLKKLKPYGTGKGGEEKEEADKSKKHHINNQDQKEDPEESNLVLKYFQRLGKENISNYLCLPLDGSCSSAISIQYLVEPLSLWLDNCTKHPNEIEVLRNIWIVLVGCVRETNMRLFDISAPFLNKISTHMAHSSLSSSMITASKVFLSSLSKEKSKQEQSELFFLSQFFKLFLEQFPQTSISQEEESYEIFFSLLKLVSTNLTPVLIADCVAALSNQQLKKGDLRDRAVNLLCQIAASSHDATIFLHLLEITLFSNIQPVFQNKELVQQLKPKTTRSASYDLKLFCHNFQIFEERLSIASTAFGAFRQVHFDSILQSKSYTEKLKNAISRLCNSSDSRIKIQSMLLLKKLLEQYVFAFYCQLPSQHSEADLHKFKQDQANPLIQGDCSVTCIEAFINATKREEATVENIKSQHMLICQLVLQISHEILSISGNECKLQFNILAILDFLFQTLLTGPSIKSILSRMTPPPFPANTSDTSAVLDNQSNKIEGETNVLQHIEDIQQNKEDNSSDQQQNLTISRSSSAFLEFRIQEIIKLLPFINQILSSSWSNIRSLAYGLLCFWVKPYPGVYNPNTRKILEIQIFQIIRDLLMSTESECRTGGLNILGSLCGLGYDFDNIKEQMTELIRFFRLSEDLIPRDIWDAVFKIQMDWDQTNQAASVALAQLCMPKKTMILLFTEASSKDKKTSCSKGEGSDHSSLFWVEKLKSADIRDFISMFRNEYKPPASLWIEKAEYSTGVDIEDIEPYNEEIQGEQILDVDAGIPVYDDGSKMTGHAEILPERNQQLVKSGRLRAYGRFQDQAQQDEAQNAWNIIQEQRSSNSIILEVEEEENYDEEEHLPQKKSNRSQLFPEYQQQMSPRDFLRERKKKGIDRHEKEEEDSINEDINHSDIVIELPNNEIDVDSQANQQVLTQDSGLEDNIKEFYDQNVASNENIEKEGEIISEKEIILSDPQRNTFPSNTADRSVVSNVSNNSQKEKQETTTEVQKEDSRESKNEESLSKERIEATLEKQKSKNFDNLTDLEQREITNKKIGDQQIKLQIIINKDEGLCTGILKEEEQQQQIGNLQQTMATTQDLKKSTKELTVIDEKEKTDTLSSQVVQSEKNIFQVKQTDVTTEKDIPDCKNINSNTEVNKQEQIDQNLNLRISPSKSLNTNKADKDQMMHEQEKNCVELSQMEKPYDRSHNDADGFHEFELINTDVPFLPKHEEVSQLKIQDGLAFQNIPQTQQKEQVEVRNTPLRVSDILRECLQGGLSDLTELQKASKASKKRRPRQLLRLCDSLDLSVNNEQNKSSTIQGEETVGELIDQAKCTHVAADKTEFSEFQTKSQPKGVIHSRTKEVAFRGNGSKKIKNQERKSSANRQNKTFDIGKTSTTMLTDNLERKEHSSKSYSAKSYSKMPFRQSKINAKLENSSSNQSANLSKNQKNNNHNNNSQYYGKEEEQQHQPQSQLNHEFITENSNESPDYHQNIKHPRNHISNIDNTGCLLNKEDKTENSHHNVLGTAANSLDKLIKKLLAHKGLNSVELRSVVKLSQQSTSVSSQRLTPAKSSGSVALSSSKLAASFHSPTTQKYSKSPSGRQLNASLEEFKKHDTTTTNISNIPQYPPDRNINISPIHSSNQVFKSSSVFQQNLPPNPISTSSERHSKTNHSSNQISRPQSNKSAHTKQQIKQEQLRFSPSSKSRLIASKSASIQSSSHFYCHHLSLEEALREISTSQPHLTNNQHAHHVNDRNNINNHYLTLNNNFNTMQPQKTQENARQNNKNNLSNSDQQKFELNISQNDEEQVQVTQEDNLIPDSSLNPTPYRRTNSLGKYSMKVAQSIDVPFAPSLSTSFPHVSASSMNKKCLPLTLSVLAASQKRCLASPSQIDRSQNGLVKTTTTPYSTSLKKSHSSQSFLSSSRITSTQGTDKNLIASKQTKE